MMNTTPQSSQSSGRQRGPHGPWTWLGTTVVLIALVGLAVIYQTWRGSLRAAPVEQMDLSTRKQTAQGLYAVAYEVPPQGIPINQLHSWTLRVTTPEGQPVADAAVEVTGDMPQHGHGLAAVPQVSPVPRDRTYRVDGLKFQMKGHWVMTVKVNGPAGKDQALFDLQLK